MSIPSFKPDEIAWAVTFDVAGEPASKANSRQLAKIKGRTKFIKSAKALAYVKAFQWQCPRLPDLLEGDLLVAMRVHYASRRPDMDESVILDAMEGFIYKNDRQVRERHTYWALDKDHPRTEIWVARLDDLDR